MQTIAVSPARHAAREPAHAHAPVVRERRSLHTGVPSARCMVLAFALAIWFYRQLCRKARQLQEAAKPRFTLLGELGDVRPIIAVANHGANGHDHDVDQPMPRPADNAGILEGPEILLDPSHGVKSGHAFLRKAGEIREDSTRCSVVEINPAPIIALHSSSKR